MTCVYLCIRLSLCVVCVSALLRWQELTSEKPPSLAEVEKRVLFDEGGIPSATATSSAATLRKGGGGGGMSTLRLTTATRSAEEAEGMNIRHKSTRVRADVIVFL